MSQDPGSLFGRLMLGCISDRYTEDAKGIAEGVAVTVVGFICSVATVYAFSLAGIF